MPIIVTAQVCFGENDGESLPLLKCVCGKKYEPWDAVLGIEPDNAWKCDDCGRRLCFRNSITVYQVTE